MPAKVAIYGGSFDPPHVSHVLAPVYALKCGQFERVLVVPVFEHAFQKELAPFEHRVRMCRLAMQGIFATEVCEIERELTTPSLTLRTVERLRAEHPDWDLSLLIGSDVLAEAAKWHAFDRLLEIAPPFIVARPGFPHPEARGAALPDVSSTRIRAALRRRNAGDARFLRGSVPSAVLEYIDDHGLYRARAEV